MRRLALIRISLSLIILLSFIGSAQTPDSREAALIKPGELAAHMKGPMILSVGFQVLYGAAHVAGAEYAGPGSKPEGLELLKKAVAGQPRDREIVLTCGCCPWDHCPNVRPALALLRDMGFTHVRALMIPENLKAD